MYGSTQQQDRDLNVMTRFVSLRGDWRTHPVHTLESVLRASYARVREAVAHYDSAGCIVGVASTAGIIEDFWFVHAFDPAVGADALVAGRHTSCGIHLADDSSVALRHVVITATLQPDGTPLVRVLDLFTGQGFPVEQAGICDSVTTDGPMLVQLGAYALVFLPTTATRRPWPDSAEQGIAELPARKTIDLRRATLGEHAADQPRALPARGHGETHVTVVRGPCSPNRRFQQALLPQDTFATLTLGECDQDVVYPMTRDHLERGVLIGRYGRCGVSAERMPNSFVVSRVHLLLLSQGGKILVVDTASSNGTLVGGIAAAAAFVDDGDVIEMAQGNFLQWRLVHV